MQTLESIEAKITEIEAEIGAVDAKIDSVELEIKNCNAKEAQSQDAQEKIQLRNEKGQLRNEKGQLRDEKGRLQVEKQQLRDEKKQLRDEKIKLDDKGNQIQVAPESEITVWSDCVLRNAARNAFQAPYQDSIGVVQSLIEAMQKCRQLWESCVDPHEMLYAPYIAVVQASMMGKTRMFFTLHEHNIYVFYICLRADGSYPSGIREVIEALTSETCTEGYYAAFMLTALEALHHFKCNETASMPGYNSYLEWFKLQQNPSFWTPILGENQFQIFCL
jgi:hypothetical protein